MKIMSIHQAMVTNLGMTQKERENEASRVLNLTKRSVLRRQSGDTNRNTKRSVYCQYG